MLDTFRMIAAAPAGSLGAYVITMTRSASDVLAVDAAAEGAAASPGRCASCRSSRPSRDLQQAGAVVDTLLGEPSYRDRIGGRQEVMIGYSDSAKDVGPRRRRLGSLQGAGGDRRRVCRATASA